MQVEQAGLPHVFGAAAVTFAPVKVRLHTPSAPFLPSPVGFPSGFSYSACLRGRPCDSQ